VPRWHRPIERFNLVSNPYTKTLVCSRLHSFILRLPPAVQANLLYPSQSITGTVAGHDQQDVCAGLRKTFEKKLQSMTILENKIQENGES